MSLLIRGLIFSLIIIGIISFFFRPHVAQQTAMMNYQKEAEMMRNEQEQKACNQFINAKFCTSPRDRYERFLCSQRLSEFHCSKHVDVGYLILEEHQQKNQPAR